MQTNYQYYQSGHLYVRAKKNHVGALDIVMVNTFTARVIPCTVTRAFTEGFDPCPEYLFEIALDSAQRRNTIVLEAEMV